MPPTRHSTSTAHKESDQIPADQNYTLGEYSFRVERTSVPGSSNDKIEAICTKDGKNARKSIQVPSSTQIDGWYVEANEDTADVYAVVEANGSQSGSLSGVEAYAGQAFATGTAHKSDGHGGWIDIPAEYNIVGEKSVLNNTFITYADYSLTSFTFIAYSVNSFMVYGDFHPTGTEPGSYGNITLRSTYSYTKDNKTVLYNYGSLDKSNNLSFSIPISDVSTNQEIGEAAWNAIYGQHGESGTYLIGRFAIDLEDAGGTGPGSDWDDPGDWDDDWEEGDPTQTLQLAIEGALSGRHNDPLNDTSYSYLPSDKATAKDYGCGGDGGHGGGGGAGASTVVVHKFATDKADSKEIVCKAKRHGYGSGGGKGGKGGDGCILIYY